MKTFIKVFSIVITLLISSSGYGFERTKQCVITPNMETTWIKVVDIDPSGNTLNNGWPLFDGVLSKHERAQIKCTYGHITIHYQTKSSGRTYVITNQSCNNNNTITVP